MNEALEWRVSLTGRAASWVFVVGGVAGAIAALVAIPLSSPLSQWWSIIPVLALCGGTSLAGYRFGIRPRILAGIGGIVVVNPLRRLEIPWEDVEDITPSSLGLAIRRKDGQRFAAWAVQKSNWSAWTGRHTRADDVAAALQGRLRGRAI